MAYRPIFYDTETTGLKPDKDRIIELAAFDPYLDKKFHFLINPQVLIPEETIKIHQITNEMVQSAPPFSEVAPLFTDFCSGECVLIAHNNNSFDQPFLEAEFRRASVAFPHHCFFIDSLLWARKYRSDLPRHPLQYLREIYGIPPNQAHRAMNDVLILFQVFSRMIGDLSMETVVELMTSLSIDQHLERRKEKNQSQKATPISELARGIIP